MIHISAPVMVLGMTKVLCVLCSSVESKVYLRFALKKSKLSSSVWYSPLRFARHFGGLKWANWPRVVGVELQDLRGRVFESCC